MPNVTPDGAALAFTADALTGPNGDPLGPGLYLYSAARDELLTVAPDGSLPDAVIGLSYAPECGVRRGLVDDGSQLFFTTDDALVPQDANGVLDVYGWEDGEIELISGGAGGANSVLLGVSRDGRNVFFTTSDQLVAADQDGTQDIYDARVGGVDRRETEPPACADDECQGAPASRGDDVFAASALLQGGGNHETQHGRTLTIEVVRKRIQHGCVRLSVGVREPGRLVVQINARLAGRKVLVGRAAKRISKAGTVGVKVCLSSDARTALSRGRPLRLAIHAGLRDSAQSRVVRVTEHA